MKIEEKNGEDIYYKEIACTKALRLEQVSELGKLKEASQYLWSLRVSPRKGPCNEIGEFDRELSSLERFF